MDICSILPLKYLFVSIFKYKIS